jgi:hypothetical protein
MNLTRLRRKVNLNIDRPLTQIPSSRPCGLPSNRRMGERSATHLFVMLGLEARRNSHRFSKGAALSSTPPSFSTSLRTQWAYKLTAANRANYKYILIPRTNIEMPNKI